MLTGELKNKVDKIWESFWTGGITNPLDSLKINHILDGIILKILVVLIRCMK